MYMTKITDDYDNITSSNYTVYDNISVVNFTNNENNFDITIPTLFFKIPCGQCFLCSISFMIYTLISHLFKIKWIGTNIYIQIILYVVLYVDLLTSVEAFF